jgi:hypothetical protein
MHPLLLALIGILAVGALWSVVGSMTSRAEEARYTIIRTTPAYELRRYAPRMEARVTIPGTYQAAIGDGFRILAGYIFGGNKARTSVAMTAPVVARKSESIAMTAPVIAQKEGSGSYTIAFVMPANYTRETLPEPNDSRIEIVEIPEEQIAVHRFSWYASQARVESLQQKLLAALAQDGIAPIGSPGYAGYNPPWAPPWMLRNEVWVKIAS